MSQTKAQLVDIVGGVGNGTAALPALTGDDTDTGISFGTNTVTTSVGGAAATTLDSSGRLLVGETSSTQAGSIDAKVQVISTDFNAALTVRRNQASDGAPGMLFCKSRGTSNSANVVVNSGDGLGNIRFFGADSTGGNDFAEGGAISCVVDGTPGSNDMPGRLEFKTTSDGSDGPTERARITNNGSFCIMSSDTTMNTFGAIFTPASNTSTQPSVLNFSKTHSGTIDAVVFRYNGSRVGSIRFGDSATQFTTSSDYRLKENVVNLDGAIDRVKKLAPKRFNFIVDPNKTVDGFIAHEAQTVVPEAVTGVKDEVAVWQENESLPDGVSVGDNKLDEDGNTIPLPQGIDQSKLVPLLTAALQEAIAKLETLEAANTAKDTTIAALDARLAALEAG